MKLYQFSMEKTHGQLTSSAAFVTGGQAEIRTTPATETTCSTWRGCFPPWMVFSRPGIAHIKRLNFHVTAIQHSAIEEPVLRCQITAAAQILRMLDLKVL